jgi:tetraacyldisaccharide 4'-kinase
MVACLVREILEAGRHPCIAMRGYQPRAGAREGGSDEAAWYREQFPDLPLVAQPDRAAGLTQLLETEEGRAIDCVVLDDGFQHRQLHRNADFVLVDASRDPLHDRLLPAGWLREPLDSLMRADAVVMTHTEGMTTWDWETLQERLRFYAPEAVFAPARHEWGGLTVRWDQGTARREERPLACLAGRPVLCVCAIGNPHPFLRQAASLATIAGQIVLRDHHPYDDATVRLIARRACECGAQAILTTEKDWAKLASRHASWPCPVVTADLRLTFAQGWDELRRLTLRAIERRGPAPPR